MKSFNESTFCVAFAAECSAARLCQGWQEVLDYLEKELEASEFLHESLNDKDSWSHVDLYDGGDDTRFIYNSEVDESVYLTITRITDYD